MPARILLVEDELNMALLLVSDRLPSQALDAVHCAATAGTPDFHRAK